MSHPKTTRQQHIAIVGAGWAGCAAAVRAVQAGAQVTLIEASRTAGGRARSVVCADTLEGELDNGQHILIGAYTDTLALMRTVGAHPDDLLSRMPLDLRTPDGNGLLMQPMFNAQFATVYAILRARGWSWSDKASLLLAAARWRIKKFQCPPDISVRDLCRDISERIYIDMIEPLCIAAFNSAPEYTSGRVFLRVLHDALLLQANHSDVLIARKPLGKLLPEPALAWLQNAGVQIHMGKRVQAIASQHQNKGVNPWQLQCGNDVIDADQIILACPAWEAARLVRQRLDVAGPDVSSEERHWVQRAENLQYAPIATIYAWCPSSICQHLAPMQALHCFSPDQAQFVFHHRQQQRQAADGSQQTLLAFVASACNTDRMALQAAVLDQAEQQLGFRALKIIQTYVEKRATFVCSPALLRPAMHIAPGLFASGDYVQGAYPATLEGAVRSGIAAAELAVACS